MSFGFGFGLPSWQALSGGFTPASLFSAGEQGAWYDPTDVNVSWRRNLLTYTEQFDNAAWTKVNATVTANATVAPDGTTTADKLVSAVGALHERAEQAVTIAASTAYTFTVYAKADGANFAGFRVAQDAAPSVWFDLVNGTVGTVEGGWSAAVITAAGNGWYRCKATYTTVGTSYTFRIFLSGSNGDSIFTGDGIKGIFLWGAQLELGSTASLYQQIVTPEITYLQTIQPSPVLFTDSAGTTPVTGVEQFVGRMLDKSGRGNHATSTGTKRPKLAARYNLLTYSEQFDNAVWQKFNTSISANAVVAPDATLTADKLIASAANASHAIWLASNVPITSGASYTASISVKAAEYGFAFINCNVGAFYRGATINLSTGVLTHVQSGATASVVNSGNGWYRVTVTVVAAAATGSIEVWPTPVNFTASNQGPDPYLGDGTSGIFIWGADLRPTSQATGLIGPTYQRVAAATDYDTVGFLPYLAFDGVDDSMSTGSIDFTATDKMTVFAGVRKLSDATTGTVFETSATYSGNNGSFALFSAYAANTHAVTARGSTGNGEAVVSTFTAPITNVISGSINLALNSVSSVLNVRVNGVVPSTAYTPTPSSAMGVGNFGNYPLFIGQRNNTNFPFNGWLSSLIIRGAQSTDSQISATESWVNGRTGAY